MLDITVRLINDAFGYAEGVRMLRANRRHRAALLQA
jgi:hypothetical protein